MKLSKRNSIIAALASVAALGLGGAAIAASTGSNDRAEAFAEALSEQTGSEITTDDVIAARKQVARDRVEQAVTDGRITREQADELIERIESGEGIGRGFRGGFGDGPGHGGFGRGFGGPAAAVAEELGLEADAVREALRDGQSLSEYAGSQGKTRNEVLDAIKRSITDGAQQRGVDPPDEETLNSLAERLADREGGKRGFGGHGHGGFGPPPAEEPEGEDSTEGASLGA
ncbi:MAG: hypothetical protein OEM67_01510 [Thermoleophilia bacterium]|nr:hypothetical protein [Thermoleophilia bacterium]MDH3725855.1 hypothetical protein [Thermoleophilia bacterium]